mgnify:CR=1 FL=1
MKEISICFHGYWREIHKEEIPGISGVYCVYENSYNPKNRRIETNKLIYIGESDNVKKAIANHPNYEDWLCQVILDHELCFSLGLVQPHDCQKAAAAALIYQHKPVLNNNDRFEFAFEDTTISLSGRCALLKGYFTVHKMDLDSRYFNLA